jgi:hypothetical protein
MANPKKYLIIAILIPIIMLIVVALSLLMPAEKIMPPYNLLYAINESNESYTCLQHMAASFFPKKSSGTDFYKIEKSSCQHVQLFVYDFKSDKPKPISLEDAKKLHLQEYLSNPNFYVSRNCYIGPDIGVWSLRPTYNDVCLIKDNFSKRLLNVNPKASRDIFYFISIGWIKETK